MTISEQINAFCKEQRSVPVFVYSAIVDTESGEVLGSHTASPRPQLNYELASCAKMTQFYLTLIRQIKPHILLTDITIETDSCNFYLVMSPKNKFFYIIGYLREGGNLGMAMVSLQKGKTFMGSVLEA